MRHFKITMVFFLALAFLLSLSSTAFADGSQDSIFDINESVETYGNYFQTISAGVDPDLIYARGIDGTLGYVRYSDLEGPIPDSIEAIDALQAERKATGYQGRYINLYASDGSTVIGSFFVSMPDPDSDINSRAEMMYSQRSSLQLPDFTALGWSAIQQVSNGVKYYSIVQTDQVVYGGRVASRSFLYDADTGAMVDSTEYDYGESSGTYFPQSKTYRTSSGNYYCRGVARLVHPDGSYGSLGLAMTPIVDID